MCIFFLVSFVSVGSLDLVLGLLWESDDVLFHIYVEIEKILKGFTKSQAPLYMVAVILYFTLNI